MYRLAKRVRNIYTTITAGGKDFPKESREK
jgi:hypothetical protein